MNKKPSIYATLLTSTLDEARMFDKWFYEREADFSWPESSESTDEPCFVDLKKLEQASGDYDGNIAAGQVRILSKRFTRTPEVVPFVVVLEKWEERVDGDMWLVAPFSPYSTPATSGEMTSGANLLWREVIQAWNARTIQDSLLEKSYLCGVLDEKTVREARALFRNQFAGTALPADFSAVRGSKVYMDGDPRREYLVEEIDRLRPLSTAVKATERARSENLIVVDFAKARENQEEGMVLQPLYGGEEYRLAAAGKPAPTTEHFRVIGTELTLMYSPEDGSTVFTFWDESDRPDSRYDGCAVLGTGGVFLGTFCNGTLRVPADAVKGWFQITDKDGATLKLVKE